MDRGKIFENKLKEQVPQTIEDCFFFRLNDQTSGYYGASRNPCDFILYKKPQLHLLEAKSIQGNTFSTNFRQYEELIKYKDIPGVYPGVIIWFVDHDKQVWVPIQTFEKLIKDGKKSFNINKITDDYDYLEIPTTKLKVYLKGDYSSIIKYCEDKFNAKD